MNHQQIQCLLRFLDYYPGPIDGIFGSRSREACRVFQAAAGLPVTGLADPQTQEALKRAVAEGMPQKKESFWDEIKYFTREEFRCRCGGKFCAGFPAEPSQALLRLADRVREHFGAPAILSSGLRCERHNANVGGVAGSRHLGGKAMDFRVRDHSAREVLAFVAEQQDVRYCYDIDGTYIHMDVK